MHPNARVAAASAEAAGLQGKYWEMHDKIYEKQEEWSKASISERGDIFRSYAKSLNLDLAKFDTDLASDAVNQKISFDQAIFKTTGLKQATPAFTIDGKEVPDDAWRDDNTFDKFIREKLSAAGVKLTEDTTDKE